MRISVIIPTRNRKGDLLITVRSLLRQSRPPEEIIIVDQSRESCREELTDLFKADGNRSDLIYIRDTSISGAVDARMTGFNRSRGEIIFFIDDDMTLEPDCIKNLIQTYEENPHFGGLGGVDTSWENKSLFLLLAKTIFTCGPFSLDKGGWFFTGWIPHYFHNRLTRPYPTRWIIAGIMSFKRNVFEDIGFDRKLEGYFIGDADISIRASEKYPLAIVPTVKAYHRGEAAPLYNIRENYEKRICGDWYCFNKNIEKTPLNTLLFLWSHFGRLLGTIAASIYYGTLDPLRGYMSGMKAGAAQYRKSVSAGKQKK